MEIIAKNITGIKREKKDLIKEINESFNYEENSMKIINTILSMLEKCSYYTSKFFETNNQDYGDIESCYRYTIKFILDINKKDNIDSEILETKVYKLFGINKLIKILENNSKYQLCINSDGDYTIPLNDNRFYVLHEYGIILQILIYDKKNILKKIIL